MAVPKIFFRIGLTSLAALSVNKICFGAVPVKKVNDDSNAICVAKFDFTVPADRQVRRHLYSRQASKIGVVISVPRIVCAIYEKSIVALIPINYSHWRQKSPTGKINLHWQDFQFFCILYKKEKCRSWEDTIGSICPTWG
jgi:hypothetical protein